MSFDLAGFPVSTLRGDQTIYRMHPAARSPWWFANDDRGRFNPTGSKTVGACYLADDPLAAWLEVFRKQLLIPETYLRARAVLDTQLGRPLRLADLTSRRALRYGVTSTLGASEDYGESQRFATAVVDAGFDGVRYFPRHDNAQTFYAYAVFGPVGAPTAEDKDWPVDADDPIGDALIADAQRIFGYRVIPPR